MKINLWLVVFAVIFTATVLCACTFSLGKTIGYYSATVRFTAILKKMHNHRQFYVNQGE